MTASTRTSPDPSRPASRANKNPAGVAAPLPFGGTLQRKCACGKSSGSSGTCEQCREQEQQLQRKAVDTQALAANSPAEEGRHEAEADRVADQVLASTSSHAPGPVQPESARPSIQRHRADSSASPGGVPAAVTSALSSPGTPLAAESRQFFEPRFGHDFSRVRIHINDAATDSVAAQAFTVGERIVFGSNHFQPSTDSGRRLLAHELTHVVQQAGGSGASTARGQRLQKKGGLLPPEKVAEVYGSWVIELSRARHTGAMASTSVDADARERTKKQVGPANFANWERWEEGKQQAAEAKADADNPKKPAAPPLDPQAQLYARYDQMWKSTEKLRNEVVRAEHRAQKLNFGKGVKGEVARQTASAYANTYAVGSRSLNTVLEHGPMVVLGAGGLMLGSELGERTLVQHGREMKKEYDEIIDDSRTSDRLASGELQAQYEATRPTYKRFEKAFSDFTEASIRFKKNAEPGGMTAFVAQAKDIGDMETAMKAMRETGDDFLMACAKMGIDTDSAALDTLGGHTVKGMNDAVGNAVMFGLPEVAPGLGELKTAVKGARSLGVKQVERVAAEELAASALKSGEDSLASGARSTATHATEDAALSTGGKTAIREGEESALKSGASRETGAPGSTATAETPGASKVETPPEKGAPSSAGDAAASGPAKRPPPAEAEQISQLAKDGKNVRAVEDPKFTRDYDVEISVEANGEKHTYRRKRSDGSWCRFSKVDCNLKLNPEDEAAIQKAAADATGATGEAAKVPEAPKAAEPDPLDQKIAEAQNDLNESRQKLTDYKDQRAAAGRSLKGGPSKGVWNAKERLWLLRRQKIYPKRQMLEQVTIVGVKDAGGTLKPSKAFGQEGRILDFAELNGQQVTAGDLKSAEELMGSVKGGVKKPGPITGTIKPKSKLGQQIVKEDALLKDAAANKGKVVLQGTDVRTGQSVTIEVDPANFDSTVVTYDDLGGN